jgi:hypothetical protein
MHSSNTTAVFQLPTTAERVTEFGSESEPTSEPVPAEEEEEEEEEEGEREEGEEGRAVEGEEGKEEEDEDEEGEEDDCSGKIEYTLGRPLLSVTVTLPPFTVSTSVLSNALTSC